MRKLKILYRFGSILFFIIPLLYYSFFMSKTVGYVDSSLVLYNAYELNISAWVDNHNLFSLISYILIKLFRTIDPFIVCNSFSMVCGSLTVFFTYKLSKEISGDYLIASVVSLLLMISHSLTWHSTMLEVYTVNTFLIMVMFYCFYVYFDKENIIYAYWGVFAWGLGISNHMMMGLFVFAVISFLIIRRKSLSAVNVLLGLVFFLAGFSLFLFAFIRSALRYDSLVIALHRNTGGDFRSLMFSREDLLFWLKNYFYFFLYQFSLPVVLLGIRGLKPLCNLKPFSIFFLVSFFTQIVWSLNYHVWDIFAFSLPVYVLFAIPLAFGLRTIKSYKFRMFCIGIAFVFSIGQIYLYRNISNMKIVREYVDKYPMVKMVGNTFDPAEYFLNPWKRDFNHVDSYVNQLFRKLPARSILYDNVYDYPIVYYYKAVNKVGLDIESPIIFPFWVRNDDIGKWSREINHQLKSLRSVYLSEFVFITLEKSLNYGNFEKIFIYGDEFLYLLQY